eukprot:m51a1_g3902 putative transforming growth factor beta regulator 1 (387) ;mRNA; f:117802-119534
MDRGLRRDRDDDHDSDSRAKRARVELVPPPLFVPAPIEPLSPSPPASSPKDGQELRRSKRKSKPNVFYGAEEASSPQGRPAGRGARPSAPSSSPTPPTPVEEDAWCDPALIVVDDPGADKVAEEERRAARMREARFKTISQRLFPKPLEDPALQPKAIEELGKRKRKKAPAEKAAVKYYTDVPRTPDGSPVMPIVMKAFTVLSLGTIVTDRKKFHSKYYIWPVGYKSTKQYTSMTTIDAKATYISEILDGGDAPKFRVTCIEEGKKDTVIEGATASGVWAEIHKRADAVKESVSGKRQFTQLSGPEMYGYSNTTIAKLIQDLPGAKQCSQYIFQKFDSIENKPRQGAGGGAQARESGQKDAEMGAQHEASGGSSDDSLSDDPDAFN